MNSRRHTRRCLGCGARLKVDGLPAEVASLVLRFAKNHERCADVMGAPKYRCGTCGDLLLWEDRCPKHWSSVRVEWTQPLAAAYRAVVDSVASGLRPSVPAAEADAFSQALRLSEKWGRMRGLGAAGVVEFGEQAS